MSNLLNSNIQFRQLFLYQLYFFIMISFFLVIANYNNKLTEDIYLYVCFILIATIGISHGALDNQKGRYILITKFPKYWSLFFYGSYIGCLLFVLLFWINFPLITLCIFFIISSFHFGHEDLEIFLSKKNKFDYFFYFFRGFIIITSSLYFNYEETLAFINILLLNQTTLTLGKYFFTYGYYVNLFFLIFLIFVYFFYNYIDKKEVLIITSEIVFIIILFKYLPLIVAFTVYFCFMHSTKHILSLSMELDHKNPLQGIKKFVLKSIPLTLITFVSALIMLIYLQNNFSINDSMLKIIFIGLASLTLPHIMLEYIYGKHKQKFK